MESIEPCPEQSSSSFRPSPTPVKRDLTLSQPWTSISCSCPHQEQHCPPCPSVSTRVYPSLFQGPHPAPHLSETSPRATRPQNPAAPPKPSYCPLAPPLWKHQPRLRHVSAPAAEQSPRLLPVQHPPVQKGDTTARTAFGMELL